MDRRQIALRLVMDQLELPVRMDTFENRLILQKAVYLAQAAGVHLGYFYGWYLHGPYCRAVAEDGFCVAAETAQDRKGTGALEGWRLDKGSSESLEKVRALIPEAQEQRARELELLASVHFLVDRRQVDGDSPEAIAKLLRKYNKDFGEDDVKEALGKLRDHGLIGCRRAPEETDR